MVVLTVVTTKNPYNVHFEFPLEKIQYARLLSCSIHNSWFNLPRKGTLWIRGEDKQYKKVNFPAGFYTMEVFDEEIKKEFKKISVNIETQLYSPEGKYVIYEPEKSQLLCDQDLSCLLFETCSANRNFNSKNIFKDWNSPEKYIIHCDVLDKKMNIFNGKGSDVLACFDIKGKPHENVYYSAEHAFVLRDVVRDRHIENLEITVRDENGNIYDFKGLPLSFEIEFK